MLTEPSVVVPATRLHHLLAQLGRAYELCNDFAAAHATYQTMLVTARQMHGAMDRPDNPGPSLSRSALVALGL